MERLQAIVTRPQHLRPAQDSKVPGAEWAGLGWVDQPVPRPPHHPLLPPRSLATTTRSLRAAWSHCCCWARG